MHDTGRCYQCAYFRKDVVPRASDNVPMCGDCREDLEHDAERIAREEKDRKVTFSLTR